MKRRPEIPFQPCHRQAFSMLEVIAAVVILGVIAAATVTTVAPLRARSNQRLGEQQLAALNSMSQMYFLELGEFPPHGLSSLISAGYLSSADQPADAQNGKMRSQYSYNRKTGTFASR